MTNGSGQQARLLGYCRVSTAGQADSGISLEEQRHRITRYAQAHGLALVGFETDAGASGKTLARPAFQRVLRRLRAGEADGLVAIKLDRFTRSIRDAIDLVGRAEKEGWALHSLQERLDTGSAVGRFTVHLLGALAELERAQVSERTTAALGELRRRGRRISGKPPLGYRFKAGALVEVPEEMKVLARMRALQSDGLGAKKIAAALNRSGGLSPRTGRPWHYSTIASVLRRVKANTATE